MLSAARTFWTVKLNKSALYLVPLSVGMATRQAMIFVAVLTTLGSLGMCQEFVSYEGYSLLRITPKTQPQLQFLLKMNANVSNGLDFWLRTTAVHRSADVVVPPFSKDIFLRDLARRKISYKYLIEDIGKTIEEDERDSVYIPRGLLRYFAQYNSAEQISTLLSRLAETYPSHVSVIEIGNSYEGRPLQLLKITSSSSDAKPAIWIQGGVHAREMIGTAVVLYVALQLATRYEDDDVSKLLNTFDWYVLPLANPDGYEYCRTMDRLWRKTRSFDPNHSNCVGVDANRNWNIKWNDTAGSSTDPCSNNYAGPSPFSEVETWSVADYVSNNLNELLLFLDFHSYSQRWLTPWGYTSKVPENYEEQKELALVATSALGTLYGTKYSVGSSGNIMYTVTGGARDWMHAIAGARYSYVVEARDTGHFGFLLPKRQILPTVVETWAGVKAMGLKLSVQNMRNVLP